MDNTLYPQAILGKHAIIDLSNCNAETLQDYELIKSLLAQAADIAKVTIIGTMDRYFTPHGYTAVLVLEESHLSIHTWPEFNYVSIDLYSCNLETNFQAVTDFLSDGFQAKKTQFTLLERGYSVAS